MFQLLFLFLVFPTTVHAETLLYTGVTTLGCTNGTCTLGGDCNETVISIMPGVTEDNITFTDISGQVVIFPETCTAECDTSTCIETGFDTDECIGSAGFVYCHELDDCIRPWEENCPFEGDRYAGPVLLFCIEGARCNDLSKDCSIAVGSSSLGGPYLSGIPEGEYDIAKDCLLTCQGCDCVDKNNCTVVEIVPTQAPVEDSDCVDENNCTMVEIVPTQAPVEDSSGIAKNYSTLLLAIGFVISVVGQLY